MYIFNIRNKCIKILTMPPPSPLKRITELMFVYPSCSIVRFGPWNASICKSNDFKNVCYLKSVFYSII